MLKFSNNNFFLDWKRPNGTTKKILITLIILFLFRFGSTLPLEGIDQEALKKSFAQFDSKSPLFQLINMYSGGGGISLLSPFSLGIIPYINASIVVDLLTAIFPTLEKLQSEEGELGKQKLAFYKKILTFIFAFFQALFVLSYLQPYLYNTSFLALFFLGLELITGSFLIVWLSSLLDKKGIGNGTSLIIFTNIVVTLLGKNFFSLAQFTQKSFLEYGLFFLIILLICISQTVRINIEIVSARQLSYLENLEKNNLRDSFLENLSTSENGLSIRLNQAGIFPIIIASNIFPFFSIFAQYFGYSSKILESLLYYLLIIGFNYFYTIVFWDPEKISEQLRKASVSIINVTPGKETVQYLENVVRSTSLLGGILLCLILLTYEICKQLVGGIFLSQLNISSLIILVGVAYEIQKNLKALSKTFVQKSQSTSI